MEELEIRKLIGQRIRAVRIAKKMTQLQLAEKSGMSTSNISDLENGKTNMYVTTLFRVIEALQCSADVIMRPNVPEVNNLYKQEYAQLIDGCTPLQMETIMSVTKSLIDFFEKTEADKG